MAKNVKKNSKSQKSNNQSEPVIVLWLKRIFSLKVMSFVVAVIALYFTYQGFISNKPSQISVHNSLGMVYSPSIDSKDIHHFIYLMYPNDRNLPISHGTPIVANNTNKSIKNFNLVVRAFFDASVYDYEWDANDYDIIQIDTANCCTVYKYIPNVLYAHSELPLPIERLQLKEEVPISNDKPHSVDFSYSITYDGIECDRNFIITYMAYFNNTGTKDEEQIKVLLNQCYNRGYFSKGKQDFLVTVVSMNQESDRFNGLFGGEEYDVMTPEEVFEKGEFERNTMEDLIESISKVK